MAIEWKEVSLTVPRAWYITYMRDLAEQREGDVRTGYGRVSGTVKALDALWPEYRAAVVAAGTDTDELNAAWYGLLGCWNLPRDTMLEELEAKGYPALFWNSGWGPAYRVYVFACQLLATFYRLIEDPCTGNERCQGFGEFVGAMMRGEAAATYLGSGPCSLQTLYVNADYRTAFSPRTGTRQYLDSCDVGAVLRCDGGFSAETSGSAWDNWEPVFNESYNRLVSRNMGLGGDPRPIAGVGGNNNHNFVTRLHPARLAWDGFECDYLLFLARLCYDYRRSNLGSLSAARSAELSDAATRLARYALRVIVDNAELWVHELGHTYTESGHCGGGAGCCFEYAASFMVARLCALLGLPADHRGNTYYEDPTMDKDPLSVCLTDEASDDANPGLVWTLDTPLTPAGDVLFCCRPCAAGSAEECFTP